MQQSFDSKSIRVRSQKVQGQRRDELWILKGLIAGVAGGFVASAVMNQFQALWAKRIEGIEKSHGAQSMQQGSPRRGVARKLQERGSEEEQDDATERLASAVSDGLFRHRLTALEKDIAGTATHYGLGVAAGALYGIGVELAASVRAGEGALFGAFVWLAAEEGAVPGLGLSKWMTQYPARTHAYALASHLIFGLATERRYGALYVWPYDVRISV